MRLILILSLFFFFTSCQSNEDVPESSNNERLERSELSMDSKIFLGNRLFSEKTCIKCHAKNRKKRGPSVVDIMHVYRENDADIVTFLKGHSEPIMGENDSLVAVMQANIDGFLKKITDEELNAISTYMMHIDEQIRK